jgi:endonuclease/exonuclease/phosphatase (EEP) superfamily protein YafD
MPEAKISRVAHRVGFALLLASAALWIVTTIFFVGVWDHVAAITTFPQWAWATAGILGAAIAWCLLRPRNRSPIFLMVLWLLTTVYFADNVVPFMRGLAHGAAPSPVAPSGTLRVISLNCATSPAAAHEVMMFQPDIVLLQESPTSNKVAQLARELFGSNAWSVVGWDCAIISRYPLTPFDKIQGAHYTRAIVMLPHHRESLVTSVRLTPPLGSMDLWKPSTWRAYTEDRRLRTRQLRAVLEVERPKPKLPEIVGGDFNAPAGDGIYKLLHEYRDSHRRAGRGWGGTALNTIPIFRPDQIWLKHLTAASCYAVETGHSDHRMVVTDVFWNAN